MSIILPRTVLDEFTRNKAEVARRLGDAKTKLMVLEQLNDVAYKIPSLGEAAIESIGRIDKLFNSTTVVEASDEVNWPVFKVETPSQR